MTYNL